MAERYNDRDSKENSLSVLFRIIVKLVELWLIAIVLILGAAFVMSLLGANPDASFASWIYDRTKEIMRPFDGIFEPIELDGDTVVETSLLFAILVYGVIAGVIGAMARHFTSD